jgi:hypothetical protein
MPNSEEPKIPNRIITSTYRYKRPPRKKKPQAIPEPAIVVGKRSRRVDKAAAAAEVLSRSPRHHDGAMQPSTLRKTEREPAVTAPPPANDDRKPVIATAKRRPGRFGDVPDMTLEEHQRRGDAADALFRELVCLATGKG